jgi:hypothetical protein
LDKKDFFAYPVTDEIAPDYHDIISHPMAFSEIIEKLNAHTYTNVEEFEVCKHLEALYHHNILTNHSYQTDIQLICRNSMTYNKADTPYFKVAQKMESYSQPLIEQAKQDYASMKISKETGILDIGLHPEIFTYNLLKIPTAMEMAAEEEERRRKSAEEEATAQAKQRKEEEEAQAHERQEQRKAAAEARKAAQRRPQENKRTTRSMQGEGGPLDALKARRKLSHEARKLLQTRAIESHPPQPLPLNKKVQRGYMYVSESDDEEEQSSTSHPSALPPSKPTLPKQPRQLRARPKQEEAPRQKSPVLKAAPPKQPAKRKAHSPEPDSSKVTSTSRKKIKLEKDTGSLFDHGRLIWARVIGFPSHPAKVCSMLLKNICQCHVLTLYASTRWLTRPRPMWRSVSWMHEAMQTRS